MSIIGKRGVNIIGKTGFDNSICTKCAYNKIGKCTVSKTAVHYIAKCPNGYTNKLCAKIAEDYHLCLIGKPPKHRNEW